jgi:glutaredoxin
MVLVEILTSPSCPHCETVKHRINRIVDGINPKERRINVKIIDLINQPEIRLKYDLMSTPAVAINGKLIFIGVPPDEDIKRELEKFEKLTV